MADGRRYGLAPKLDIGTILNEAQHRWLRPAEVCEILRNYKRFQISPEPPNRPTDGSIFLFDRKTLRYFRKDGHNWRKKKDGKTVREAHERLKAGSIDVLHCYYAHGEDNENFQRRSYWMLEEQFEHIVLVHYREVKEGGKSGIFHPVISQSPTQIFNAASSMSPLYSSPAQSNSYLAQKSYTSTPSTSEWNGTPTSDFEEVESGENLGVSSSAETEYSLAKQVHSQRLPKETVGLLSETSLRQQQHVEAFSNIASENRCNYSSFNVDNLEPRQQPLYPSAPSQQNFFECSNESQMTMTFQNSYTHDYNNNEISNRIDSHGLHVNSYPEQCVFPPVTSAFPESNYSSIRERKTEVVTNVTANRDAINSSIWPEIPELERNYVINSTGGKNVDNLESTMMEDIVRRQIQSGVAYNTVGNKHMKSECDVNNQDRLQTQEDNNSISSLQSGHYLKTSESPFSISEQQIIGLENGFLNLFQQKMSKSRSREQIREPSLLQHCQERVVEVKNNMKLMTECDLFNDSSAMQGTNTQLQESTIDIDREEALKKLDSFGKWMTSEIGEDAENSLTVSDSGMYWNTLDNQNEAEEASRSSHQIQLDNSLMVPSVSQDQLFSISDFSPDWAYSEVATKVLIWGNFLGNSQDVYREKFSVMFGEIEVPVEALGPGIFRCYTPPHFPGTVPFYITYSNRLACSEVKEFHYRQDTSQITTSNRNMFEDSMNEMRLKTRFVKLLLDDLEKGLAKLDEDKMLTLKSKICFLIKDIDEELREIERALEDDEYSFERVNEKLIQKLLMDKLYSWLLWKVNAGEKGANVLDDQGQGVIHLAAALGYDWAIKPIVSSGVNVNFRDAHGWTALHWAAFYGRERTVSALIALKANPGALTDPTHEHPTGRPPADFASNNGHKGIAGYLAESSLTNHLSSLTLTENIMGSVSATIAAEKAVENVADRSLVQVDGGKEDQLSMKDSLAAVRNAAQAAARIQAAFRMRSFRRRQAIEYEGDKSRIAEERALSRMSHSKTCRSGKPEQSLHTAATQIQRKFRGWKGRKEFLLTRQRIVKIQAHFRGHQVRKKYRLLWSVGIVEKAILRWRRKGTGLRGFRNDDIDEVHSDVIPNKDIDDYEFLRNARKQSEAGIEKALARVQSMVQYPEARNQYRRLLEMFQESKIEAEKYVKEEAQTSGEQKLNEDFPMSFAD